MFIGVTDDIAKVLYFILKLLTYAIYHRHCVLLGIKMNRYFISAKVSYRLQSRLLSRLYHLIIPFWIACFSISFLYFSFISLGIQKLILTGRISEAIDTIHSLYPGLMDQNPDLFFKLKCRQFIEMVNGCDGEVKTYAHSPSRSLRNSPCVSPVRTLSTGNSSATASGSSFLLRKKSLGEHNEMMVTASATSTNGSAMTSLHQNGDSEDTNEMSVDDDDIPTDRACPVAEDVNNDSEMMDTSDNNQASSSSQHSSTSSAVSVITNSSKGSCIQMTSFNSSSYSSNSRVNRKKSFDPFRVQLLVSTM